MEAVVWLNSQSELLLIAGVGQRRGGRTTIYGLTEISATVKGRVRNQPFSGGWVQRSEVFGLE